mmetsp:Transcript_33316/g.61949  ORF Transcript_33316/g.61949 Transcript_33316/m.61949 type:complete len:208 (-) Transcript_33316:209-832(-)
MTTSRTAIVLGLLAALAHGYIVEVGASSEECFQETIKRGQKCIGSYSVAAGGNLDIDLRVTDALGKTLYENLGYSDDSFAFVANQDGKYKVCFSNAMSSLTSKTVSFNIYVGTALVDHEIAKKEHLDPLENSILLLGESLQFVVNDQQYLITRERLARSTNASTKSRVFWLNFFETLVLFAVGGFQMFHLRQFLDKKSGVGGGRRGL